MLLFVGDKTKKAFNNYGIKTIGDLAFSDVNIVKKIVGEKNALKLIHFANGYEFTEVKRYGEKERSKTISRAETTYKDIENYGDLRILINRLSEDVCKRLRHENMKASGVCLKIRDRWYNERSMQMILNEPLNNGILMSSEICRLFLERNGIILGRLVSFAKMLKLEKIKLEKPVRETSVIAFRLSENIIDTFVDDKNKLNIMDKVMDEINDKYNYNLVKMGYLSEP